MNLFLFCLFQSLLSVLRESHRTRTVFRKVGGFVYVMSVLVSMEGCLADPPKTPWENGKYPLPYHWEYVVGYLCMSCQCWSQWRAASPTLQRHPGKMVSTLYLTIGSMGGGGGGFVYVMSVLVSMEGCLTDPPKTPWENGMYPLPYHWEYVVGYLCMSCQCWSQWRAASPTLQRHPRKMVSTLYLTIGSMW